MERETQEIELKISKKKVVVRSYLTESENRELIKKMTGDIRIVDGKVIEEEGNRADELIKYKDAVINAWVVSLDGDEKKINERLVELPAKDYNQVINFVKTLTEDEEKKTL